MSFYYCVQIGEKDRHVFCVSKNDECPNEKFIQLLIDSNLNAFYQYEMDEYILYLTRSNFDSDDGLLMNHGSNSLQYLYESVLRDPEYWRFRFFKTENKEISDIFLTSDILDVIDYLNSEEFIKEFYSPEGIGGKKAIKILEENFPDS